MAHGKEAARDLRFGRRGGHWVADGQQPWDPATAPRCTVCDKPLLLDDGSDRHKVCEDPTPAAEADGTLF